MKKSGIASIIAIMVSLTCLLGLVGCGKTSVDDMVTNSPRVTGISSGNITSLTGLEPSFTLNSSNGKYVTLYVENNGSNSIVATINGQSERTFKAGEKGHISLEVTQGFLGLDKDYEFKAVPGTNGGSINIYYEIAQRDEIEGLSGYSEDAGR